MRTTRVYLLRQRILQTAQELDPGAFGIDDLEAAPRVRRLRPTREELVTETDYLARHGFLEPIAESDGEFLHITASGMDQAGPDVETTRDHRIWGRAGL